GKGISVSGELVDMSLERGLIEKSGAWYSLHGARMGQGREKARAWLEERPVLMEKLRRMMISDSKNLDELGKPESWEPEPKKAPEPVSKAVPGKSPAPAGANGEAKGVRLAG